jgi:hypothetical protein
MILIPWERELTSGGVVVDADANVAVADVVLWVVHVVAMMITWWQKTMLKL